MPRSLLQFRGWLMASLLLVLTRAAGSAEPPEGPLSTDPAWRATAPLLTAHDVDGWPWHSVKDPSVVHHEGRWHLFTTVRGSDRSHAVMYCAFTDWSAAESAPRRILPCHAGYFCAPQVFWFTPHKRWYLICQASDPAWGDPAYRAAYSTTETIGDPDSWSPLQPLFTPSPAKAKIGLDFWIICDADRAHLFSTTNNGHMWRRETSLANFPDGWSPPSLALEGDIFEASHTYRLHGTKQYLTLIEAQGERGARYYKAYLADQLDGDWRPLAAMREHPWAAAGNVDQPEGRWTDSISHGELLRSGTDEHLEVDPADMRFLFQGVRDADRIGRKYGDIPWRLGILTPAMLKP